MGIRRVFRFAVRLQPDWIRRRYGREMEAAFDEGLRARRNHRARIAFATRSLADAVWSGLLERVRGEPLPGAPAMTTGGRSMGHGEAWTDLRVAARSLMRTPGFAWAAVAILGLGIGANTALFSAIRSALLTPPPFPDPDRIVLLDRSEVPSSETDGSEPLPWSYPKYEVLAATDDLPLQAVAAYAPRNLTLTGSGDATVLPVEVVTPGYFDVLGTAPVRGRGFTADDDRATAVPVALVSYEEWIGRFGGDEDLVGRTLTLAGQSVTVVGILPRGFHGLTGNARLWITPQGGAQLINPVLVRGTQAHWLQSVARLADGATLDGLQSRMRAVGAAAETAISGADAAPNVIGSARSLMAVRVGDRARRSLLVLALASALLLAVACANLGGLLAARARRRHRESAVRAALGASRWQVARGLLAESLVLALGGGVFSIGVAWAASAWLGAAWPAGSLSDAWLVDVVEVSGSGMDVVTLGFVGGLSVAVGLLLGIIPALAASRIGPGDHLRQGGVGRTHRTAGRIRGVLVAGEIAVALVLLVGAGLLVRSLHELQQVPRGYAPGHLLTFRVGVPGSSAWSDDPGEFHEMVTSRLAGVAGVESVGLGCVAPASGHCMITGVRRAGAREWDEGSRPAVGVHYVGDHWFGTLGVPLLRGRTFDSRDQPDSPPVVVLSETAAGELFPGADPLGQPVAMGTGLTPSGDSQATAEVIGIVGDVLYGRPESGLMAEVYESHRQDDSYGTFVLRTRGEPMAVVPAIRRAVREFAPDAPLQSVRTIADAEAATTSDTRLLSLLLTGFASVALLLAGTGVWATLAYAVSRRTREFGVRLALGARPGQVVMSVVGGGLTVAITGVLGGLLAAWYASRILTSLLFEVRPVDPAIFGGSAALLLVVAVTAAWLPAQRATRVDPVESLRSD